MEPVTEPVTATPTALNRFGRMYLASMQENRPQMYAEAEQGGKLVALAVAAQESATDKVVNLILMGWDPAMAQQEAMNDLMLPDTGQVPDLNQDPFTHP